MRSSRLFFALLATAIASTASAANRPAGYTTICKINQTCSVATSTTVAYGRADVFTYKVLSGSFVCSDVTFGAGSTVAGGINECSVPTATASSATPGSSSKSSVSISSAVATSKSSSSVLSSSKASVPSSSIAASIKSSAASSSSVASNNCQNFSATKTYYVSRNGSANGDGNSFTSAMDLTTALNAVTAGQMLLLEPGTYTVPYTAGVANTIKLSKSGTASAPIRVVAANCGRAVIDFSFPEQQWVQDSYGISLTGSYWYFKGIEITRAGYQGVYVTGKYNTFENCAFHNNRNTGLEINKGGAYTTVINSDAYRNYDPKKKGSMADGFGPKQTQGPGNKFIGCRAWENSDDGFDMFDSPEVVVVENSWAFRNGVDIWNYGGFTGNGNGFKLGGNAVVAKNRITNSIAFDNPKKGFDQNNNAGGVTLLNNTAYRNGTNYGFGNPVSSGQKHYFRNNVSLSGSVSIANADAKNNSWDTGPLAIAADFVSLDLSVATAARNPDGSLPNNSLFKLTATSALIDKGVSVGLPYLGSAPDLGAFEKK
ncbi:MAG TPA: right-handed parallel beta-helix repeat-containing protein [Cellvibrio sp.]|nr:right-handed parallel beta-helix repeat-containing protein [Cellvibrio sp.]